MESLEVARELGTNSMVMINDFDQGRRLALSAPTGGIVSLRELPDASGLWQKAQDCAADPPEKAASENQAFSFRVLHLQTVTMCLDTFTINLPRGSSPFRRCTAQPPIDTAD